MLETQFRKTLQNSIEVLSSGAHGNVLVNLPVEYPYLTLIGTLRVPLKILPYSPCSSCHCRNQLCMSSSGQHTGSTWLPTSCPGESLLPQRCLKSPPCTHPNTTGNDEWMYNGNKQPHSFNGILKYNHILSQGFGLHLVILKLHPRWLRKPTAN